MQYDMIVIGGGVAGLSAAVNGASEGLKTLVLDSQQRFGGQAGTSTLIENYAGFKDGVTGEALTSAMIDQAIKFRAELKAPVSACAVRPRGSNLWVLGDGGEEFTAPQVVLASGVQYRTVDARGLTEYLGRGVSYGSPSLSEDFTDTSIWIIGGANSAGQAALHLSACTGCTVHLIIRGDSISSKMSGYLVDRIKKKDNIYVHTESEVVEVGGEDKLAWGQVKTVDGTWSGGVDRLFVLVGAVPKVRWLHNVEFDSHGFILTGNAINIEGFGIKSDRLPFGHESSLPGLFVAGDLRSGSVKRCASAVGEGAEAVAEIHQLRSL